MKSALTESWLFSNLAPNELAALSRIAQQAAFKKGDFVLRESTANDSLWIIAEGQVGVFKQNESQARATLNPGDLFGEMSWLDGFPASSSIRVESERCVLLRISFKALDDYLANAPDLHVQLLRRFAINLSHRLR